MTNIIYRSDFQQLNDFMVSDDNVFSSHDWVLTTFFSDGDRFAKKCLFHCHEHCTCTKIPKHFNVHNICDIIWDPVSFSWFRLSFVRASFSLSGLWRRCFFLLNSVTLGKLYHETNVIGWWSSMITHFIVNCVNSSEISKIFRESLLTLTYCLYFVPL